MTKKNAVIKEANGEPFVVIAGKEIKVHELIHLYPNKHIWESDYDSENYFAREVDVEITFHVAKMSNNNSNVEKKTYMRSLKKRSEIMGNVDLKVTVFLKK